MRILLGVGLICMATFLALPVIAQVSDPQLQEELRWDDPQWIQRISRPLTLEDCVKIALEKNLPLEIARMQRQASSEGVTAEWGGWLPGVTLSSVRTSAELQTPDTLDVLSSSITTVTRANADITQKLPFGGNISVGYSFTKKGDDLLAGHGVNFAVVQPLLRNIGWNTAFAAVNAAKIDEAAQVEALRAQTLGIIFTVAEAYFRVLQEQQVIEVTLRAIQRDENLVEFSRAKVDAKLATRRDVLSAEIVLEQDRGNLLTTQTEYRANVDALADVMGLRVPTEITLAAYDLDELHMEIDADGWIVRAMRENPAIRSARFELENVALDLRLAGNARMPQLDLELRYDENRNSVADFADSIRRPIERAWEAGIVLSVPFLNKRPRAEQRIAKLRHEQARRVLLEAERQVGLLVRAAIRDLQRSSGRIQVLNKTIEGAKDKVEFANVNFQLGRADNFDITDAQKDLTEAETDYIDEIVSYRIALARLEQLLGGTLE